MIIDEAEWRWAGALLVAGLVAFMIGASFWKPAEFEVSAARGLEAMARHRGRVHWIVGWMMAGIALSTMGLKALSGCLPGSGDVLAKSFVVSFGADAVVLRGGFFAPPFWAHVLPAIVGAALLLHPPVSGS